MACLTLMIDHQPSETISPPLTISIRVKNISFYSYKPFVASLLAIYNVLTKQPSQQRPPRIQLA